MNSPSSSTTPATQRSSFLGVPLSLTMRRPDTPGGDPTLAGADPQDIAAARLAASWLLWYPDDVLLARLGDIAAVTADLPHAVAAPLGAFLDHVAGTDNVVLQKHFVEVFDLKRRACPFLTYWTDGDTRNRGKAILRFKQAYLEAGFILDDRELPDHLAVVLEFAAVGDRLTGDALLSEHAAAIGLLRSALEDLSSPYVHVLDAVVATLPPASKALRIRMAEIARSGPPVEQVGLEPFGVPASSHEGVLT
jgi:nitrate reductase molybdenum cofactor assembly chaperone NarJ/NarW